MNPVSKKQLHLVQFSTSNFNQPSVALRQRKGKNNEEINEKIYGFADK